MGTNTQTAEPRVQVTGHRVAPCPELPNGFYAAKISAAGQAMAKTVGGNNLDIMGVKTLVVDAAKIPQLILDLQAVQQELTAQAMTDAGGVDVAMDDDDALLAALDSEQLVTIEGPAFSGEITRAIAASGNYRMIWEALNDSADSTWDQLTDSELRAITADYKHTLTDSVALSIVELALEHDAPRPVLMKAAKSIFVGRADTIEEAEPDVAKAAVARDVTRFPPIVQPVHEVSLIRRTAYPFGGGPATFTILKDPTPAPPEA